MARTRTTTSKAAAARPATAKAAPKKATASKAATSKAATKKAATKKAARKASATRPAGRSSTGRRAGAIRVRMYRVGFGDFFLLTVPGTDGDPAHILIDCGVHAKPVKGAMDACIADLKAETQGRLDLVIATHYHADHLSGFATNYDDFLEFDVGAVWITNRLDPSLAEAPVSLTQLTAVASALELRLGARDDKDDVTVRQAADKVDNAMGAVLGAGERGNAKALQLLRSGFGKKSTPVRYYQGGDDPQLPPRLRGMITAQVLAPSPIDSDGEFSASDNRDAQYLAAAGDRGAVPHADRLAPFDREWPGRASDYPDKVFDEFDTGLHHDRRRAKDGEANLRAAIARVQPDALLAAADKLDGTLNNQSLVVLFTCRGKRLLFVGDAQWGNWAYWLYGKGVKGAVPDLAAEAKAILASLDFYKVGHHGSTNATPIPAVGGLNPRCAAMCSTAMDAYGNDQAGTEVPRTKLLEALATRTGNRTVRSDWAAGPGIKADPDARKAMAALPSGFTTTDQLYIDYVL